MRRLATLVLAGVVLALGVGVGVAEAAAIKAVTTAPLNLRAGPGTQYPVVAVLPDHAAILVHGCVADFSWCDTSWGAERGWVSAAYMSAIYRSPPVVITPVIAPRIGVGVVVFDEAYWRRHYVGRPWYGRWHVYRPVSTSGTLTCEPGPCAGSRTVTGPYRSVTRDATVAW